MGKGRQLDRNPRQGPSEDLDGVPHRPAPPGAGEPGCVSITPISPWCGVVLGVVTLSYVACCSPWAKLT